MQFTIKQGMNQDILKSYPDNHFDSIVTDPPYGIEFLGKDWDSNTGAVETWQECFRVLKPGGHILAFSAARTYHHLATNIESVGFEIRDQLMWIYGSGFPKAQDVGKAIERREGKRNNNSLGIQRSTNESGPRTNCPKCNKTLNGSNQSKCQDEVCPLRDEMKPADNEWSGWKTALKPAHEPIVMARKPFKGSTIDNVLTHGTGALNIDATRINIPEDDETHATLSKYKHRLHKSDFGNETNGFGAGGLAGTEKDYYHSEGRFPSNVLGDIPDYQKYFYCPKVSRAERHAGFDTANIPQMGSTHPDDIKKHPLWDPSIGGDAARLKRKIDEAGEYKGNNHPTVKPVELMKYLIKLVTPEGGRVLDPFNGSGSTGMAAVELGFEYTGCELDPNYVEIANQRIRSWYERTKPKTIVNDLFTNKHAAN